MVRLLLLLSVTLGWSCGVGLAEEDQEVQESSWTPHGGPESLSRTYPEPLGRPRRHQEQPLLYAVWEEPPLLVKESLTKEEATWVPENEPLEIIKERYYFGSRQFDRNFDRSPALAVKTMRFYDAGPPLVSHTPLHHTLEYPIHQPRHDVSSTPHLGRPRKYYLTGVMEELPRESGYGHPHVRKYYLQADTKEMPANDKETQVASNEIEDSAQAHGPNAVLPPPHNTVTVPPTTHSPLDSLTLTRFSPYFPPTGYDQPPPSNPTPFTYHRSTSRYNSDPPAAFRKYYLLTRVPEPHSPATVAGEDNVLDSPVEYPRGSHELSSFNIYEMLRQPRNTSP